MVPKKCPPGPTSAMASRARSSSSNGIGTRVSISICTISVSRIIFSKDAVSPPSSQPAPWKIRLACPITAAHRDISVSYTDWASGAFDAVPPFER